MEVSLDMLCLALLSIPVILNMLGKQPFLGGKMYKLRNVLIPFSISR